MPGWTLVHHVGLPADLSPTIGARAFLAAPIEDLCTVYVRFMGPDGKPVAGRLIAFNNLFTSPRHVGKGGVAFLGGASASMVTDAAGYAEINLIRGGNFEVVITGTSYARRVTIPDQGKADLLDLIGASQDQFEIARPIPLNTPRFS